MSSESSTATGKVEVCAVEDLTVERGVAALVGERQVAVFLLDDGSVHAVQQLDPYSGANILSRGLVGSHTLSDPDGLTTRVVPTVASPMYKQAWNLDTGEVLDSGGGAKLPIAVHDVEVREGRVLIAAQPRPLLGSDTVDGAAPEVPA